MESVRLIYSGVASAKDLTLRAMVDAGISPALVVDPLRLRQILNNFVSNAIKFTEKGSVEIGAVLQERARGRDVVRFHVSDTGIGVTKEAQAQLFEPYMQAAIDTARRFGGTGLGLTICRRLAEMMEGTIGMESEVGRGTTMTLTLPLLIADPRDLPKPDTSDDSAAALVASRRRAPTVEAARAEGTLVLIAEDHPTNRTLLMRLLNVLGYATLAAKERARSAGDVECGRNRRHRHGLQHAGHGRLRLGARRPRAGGGHGARRHHRVHCRTRSPTSCSAALRPGWTTSWPSPSSSSSWRK